MRTTLISILVACICWGCSSSKETQIPSADRLYKQAMEKFNDEDYLSAIEDFKTITIQYQGSDYADKAEFHLAECRYLREEFILAAAEYDVLIRSMPSSPMVPTARYKKALSYYNLSPKPQLDQKYTTQAIDEFQAFLEYSPADSLAKSAAEKITELNNKLASKDFENARLYYRMGYYKAAIAYYDYVLEHYHDSEFADDALLGKARCQKERKDFAGALQSIDLFLERYPSSDLKPALLELQTDVRSTMQAQ
ncbi:MAG: outer membrane protein assembly factor BamD [Ignavibacteriales bacterium]|nr:outer membrane protein assembly factor BamD [Ignavibacteriales bacterium]